MNLELLYLNEGFEKILEGFIAVDHLTFPEGAHI